MLANKTDGWKMLQKIAIITEQDINNTPKNETELDSNFANNFHLKKLKSDQIRFLIRYFMTYSDDGEKEIAETLSKAFLTKVKNGL